MGTKTENLSSGLLAGIFFGDGGCRKPLQVLEIFLADCAARRAYSATRKRTDP
jgi:hypothetical protein